MVGGFHEEGSVLCNERESNSEPKWAHTEDVREDYKTMRPLVIEEFSSSSHLFHYLHVCSWVNYVYQ